MKTLIIVLGVFLAVSNVAAQTNTKPSKEAVQKMTYSCPMHPRVIGKKGDDCSKCGMALTKNKTPKLEYTCPMHPEVKGKNNDKCSKCGMDLIKVKEDKK